MNDLISRQAAIDILAIGDELLSRALDEMDIVGVERDKFEWGLGLIDSYIEDFKELPSVNQWIPCGERLPDDVEIGDEYPDVIFCTDKAVYAGFYEHYLDGGTWWSVGDYTVDGVIAWMSFPKPYKGENDEI